ncbi:hypothetical protein LCGC14_1456010 [marine sediment metagenome]|uniref:Uncharacterized protein n=1 Tax=marine sediment metagenome TaxID=412755 RepID=A0A0F9JGF5_9ZZZZ
MAKIQHSGGLIETIIELGFDAVKYFEITANGTAQTLTLSPPARRLTLHNTHASDSFYFNITGTAATTVVSSTPGDNIKLGPKCIFSMDFDTVTSISFITAGTAVLVEGTLGWKGTVS